jgi:hypothetical protein
MPARCWIAPEMPAATYSCGETDLAGLADLEGVRVPARVDRGARGADRRTEGVGEGLDGTEVTAGAAATGDDDRRLGELGRPVACFGSERDDARGLRGVGDGHVDDLVGQRRRLPLRGPSSA